MAIAMISHPTCLQHQDADCHPECAERLTSIQDAVAACELEPLIRHYDASRAEREQLLRVHSQGHVEALFRRAPESGASIMLDNDTGMNEFSLDAALFSAGAAVMGVDLLMRREQRRVFCAVRPPGHHAERERAMGFCLFNNIAVAAAHALTAHGLERIAILDFDVHHGNGTEDIFRGNEQVLVCQTFQHPLYPATPLDLDTPNLVNVPLPAATTGTEFRAAVESHWLPRLHAFKPQLCLVSAGFDAHHDDPLAGLLLTESDYAWVTRQIVAIAKAYSEGRILSCLEGGYALKALGRSVVAHLRALLD